MTQHDDSSEDFSPIADHTQIDGEALLEFKDLNAPPLPRPPATGELLILSDQSWSVFPEHGLDAQEVADLLDEMLRRRGTVVQEGGTIELGPTVLERGLSESELDGFGVRRPDTLSESGDYDSAQ